MKTFKLIFVLFLIGFSLNLMAQNGDIRGVVYDNDNGEPVPFANVFLANSDYGSTTDINGFYTIANVVPGNYVLEVSYIGYDSLGVAVEIKGGGITSQNLYIIESAVQLGTVNVTAGREEKVADVNISVNKISPTQIKRLPGIGGEADLAQYLQVLPGVIFTGDQGGQLYIRGGSPIQNKILLDGMTIYNPFHSIGFFSVFETEIIRNVDVLSGGFNAEYGGRISAVIDITSKDGNKKRFGGKVAAGPFMGKLLLEGPIVKLNESGTSASFILTGKHSYLEQTSKSLYGYVSDDGLPYSFTDLYGKISLNTSNGSRINLFGFNFRDRVNFEGVAELDWNSFGGGSNFTLIPENSKMIIGGKFSFSKYDISIQENEDFPRSSAINSFTAGMDFSFYGDKNEIKYGFEVTGARTDFLFTNQVGVPIDQFQNTTELAGFFKYKYKIPRMVIEPSVRLQYYASQSAFSFEPRLGLKVNLTDYLRFKMAGGLYSQNLISAVSERDVVNLFVGFLSDPEEAIFRPNSTEKAADRLQHSIQGVVGFEYDFNRNLEFNLEGYYKHYPQLIAINRNKTSPQEPDFVTETGAAYGLDFTMKYSTRDLYLWAVYSLGFVNRDDGFQQFPTHFDRRHNVNLVASYNFGPGRLWEVSSRWNLGSGFPFTLTQGFYESFDFSNGINTDVVQGNGDLGIIYSEDRNTGRLPYYHRLDFSLKKKFEFTKYMSLEAYASVTNVYNRKNIFYFDRVEYERVNQLPIIPSLGFSFSF